MFSCTLQSCLLSHNLVTPWGVPSLRLGTSTLDYCHFNGFVMFGLTKVFSLLFRRHFDLSYQNLTVPNKVNVMFQLEELEPCFSLSVRFKKINWVYFCI